MSKHTPGPWNYSRMRIPPNEKDRRCGFVVNGPDKTPLSTRICDLRAPEGIDGFCEGEANARLIAAAPDLYKALDRVREAWAEQIRNDEEIDACDLVDWLVSWYNVEVLPALRKAEGE